MLPVDEPPSPGAAAQVLPVEREPDDPGRGADRIRAARKGPSECRERAPVLVSPEVHEPGAEVQVAIRYRPRRARRDGRVLGGVEAIQHAHALLEHAGGVGAGRAGEIYLVTAEAPEHAVGDGER